MRNERPRTAERRTTRPSTAARRRKAVKRPNRKCRVDRSRKCRSTSVDQIATCRATCSPRSELTKHASGRKLSAGGGRERSPHGQDLFHPPGVRARALAREAACRQGLAAVARPLDERSRRSADPQRQHARPVTCDPRATPRPAAARRPPAGKRSRSRAAPDDVSRELSRTEPAWPGPCGEELLGALGPARAGEYNRPVRNAPRERGGDPRLAAEGAAGSGSGRPPPPYVGQRHPATAAGSLRPLSATCRATRRLRLTAGGRIRSAGMLGLCPPSAAHVGGVSRDAQAATRSARARRDPSLRAQPLIRPADRPLLSRAKWSTFQPAQVVHFSTGLDTGGHEQLAGVAG